MIKKRSVNILGHQTSISVEEEFWTALKQIADDQNLSMNKLIANIDDARQISPQGLTGERHNLSSAIRVYVLNNLTKTTHE